MKDRKDAELKRVARDNFMAECQNNACGDAAHMIFSAIDGDTGLFGCDLPSMLVEGDPEGKWLAGYQDLVAMKSGYLLALANNGLIAHSTWFSIKENDKEAWKVVQQEYQSELVSAKKHIKDKVFQCEHKLNYYAEVNAKRL